MLIRALHEKVRSTRPSGTPQLVNVTMKWFIGSFLRHASIVNSMKNGYEVDNGTEGVDRKGKSGAGRTGLVCDLLARLLAKEKKRAGRVRQPGPGSPRQATPPSAAPRSSNPSRLDRKRNFLKEMWAEFDKNDCERVDIRISVSKVAFLHNLHSKILRLRFQPFGSTLSSPNRAEW